MSLDVAALYVRLGPKLRQWFWSRLPPRDRHRADDMVQDVFVKALVAASTGRYQDRGRPEQWLWAVACNLLRDRAGSLEARTVVSPFKLELHDHADPDRAYDRVLDRLVLDPALAALPTDDQRRAVAARYLDDLTETQASGALGITVQAVKKRTQRGLVNLRLRLGEEDVA